MSASEWWNFERDNANFARLCKLLISGGTKVLKGIFDGIHPPHVLRNHLDDPAIQTILRKLRSKRVLFQEQWDKLYGPSSSSVTSASFDISLLCLLLQHICGLPNPAKGWKDEPSPANLHTEDDIVRVRIFRNRLYGHISEPALSDVEFKKQWNNIESVLIRLGADKAAIDTLKRQSLEQESERHIIQCLEEWERNEKTVQIKIDEFRAEFNEKHQETQGKLNEILTRTASRSQSTRIAVQKITFPIVHVMSVPSQGGDVSILNYPVLKLIGDAFYALNIPWGPHVPDIKPEDLPKHVQATSPDLVVLLSEYDDLMDVKEMKNQLQLFRDLLMKVKNEESTKLIIVVTGDKSYKHGDLSSRTVENEVAYINKEILKHDKLKIMSWDSSPSPTHHDVIAGLLRKTKSRQRKLTSKEYIHSEYDGQKGFLRCRAVIQDGRLLAILKSNPSDWDTSEKVLADMMTKHRERTKVEFWESGAVTATPCISTAAPMLRKMADIYATKKIHSSQVYSYHSDERTFDIMDTFIKGLRVGHILHNKAVELKGLLQDIVVKKVDLVVYSCDIEIAKNIKCADDFPLDYWSHATRAFEHLKGILIVLTGDQSCRDGDLASDCALPILASINQMLVTVGFPSETEKISVMSWRDRPYTAHQNTLKHLLNRSQSSQQQHRSQNAYDRAGTTAHPSPQHATGTEPEFDPTRGFLRYRAELEYGQVVKVLERNPPDWHPNVQDIHFIAGKYIKVPNVILEFWADTLDGPTKGPLVTITKKSGWSMPSMPSMPSMSKMPWSS